MSNPGAEDERLRILAFWWMLELFSPQSIPAGALVTVPVPPVDTLNSNSLGATFASNSAVTACVPPETSVQVPVPEQFPLHPMKIESAAGVAVSTTDAPDSNPAEQFDPQSIPPGALLTVPVPVPFFSTTISPGGGGVPPSPAERRQLAVVVTSY